MAHDLKPQAVSSLKICLLGASEVGKTAFALQLTTRIPVRYYQHTDREKVYCVRIDSEKAFSSNGHHDLNNRMLREVFRFDIIDVPGTHRQDVSALEEAYVNAKKHRRGQTSKLSRSSRGSPELEAESQPLLKPTATSHIAHAFIVMCDVNNHNSVEKAKTLVQRARRKGDNSPVLMLANKMDIVRDQEAVQQSIGHDLRSFCVKHNTTLFIGSVFNNSVKQNQSTFANRLANLSSPTTTPTATMSYSLEEMLCLLAKQIPDRPSRESAKVRSVKWARKKQAENSGWLSYLCCCACCFQKKED